MIGVSMAMPYLLGGLVQQVEDYGLALEKR